MLYPFPYKKAKNPLLPNLIMLCLYFNMNKSQDSTPREWNESFLRRTSLQRILLSPNQKVHRDFPGGPVVKNLPPNAGDTGRSLVREDLTSDGVTKPMCHNYWAHTVGPASCNTETTRTEASTPYSPCSTAREATTMRSPHTTRRVTPAHCD